MAWAILADVGNLVGLSEAAFREKYPQAMTRRSAGGLWEVSLSGLPADVQARCRAAAPASSELAVVEDAPAPAAPIPAKVEIDLAFSAIYDRTPVYNRNEYDKWFPIVRDCENLTGKAVADYIEAYNQERPNDPITIQTFHRKRRAYREGGKEALLGKYGKNRGKSSVSDVAYNAYEAMMLKNSGVTSEKARKAAVGLAIASGLDMEEANRSASSFKRRFDNIVPNAAQCYAREGESAYNRKHAPHITRDRSNMLAGCLWVSDHLQLDTWGMYGKVAVRPWVTSWMDDKSTKFLSHYLHPTDSNSDDIFTALYDAVAKYGKPTDTLMDNGKDYRCLDLAGGRGKEQKRASLLKELGIRNHFARPYGAQSKSIERAQRELNEMFSPMCKGYCGNNVLKRPENLDALIKSGDLETFEELNDVFNDLAENAYNTRIITSGPNKGRSPNQVFDEEYRIARAQGFIKEVPEDQLRILCYRSSKDATIRRGYFTDKDTGARYTSDTLVQHNGKRAYLRYDHKKMDTADIYDAETHEFLDTVTLIYDVPVIAKTDTEYADMKKALSINKQINKFVKKIASSDMEITVKDAVAGMKVFNSVVACGNTDNAADVHNTDGVIMLTSAAQVITKKAAMAEMDSPDLSAWGGVEGFERQAGEEVYGLVYHREHDVRNVNVG